jgi:hypothetical protein
VQHAVQVRPQYEVLTLPAEHPHKRKTIAEFVQRGATASEPEAGPPGDIVQRDWAVPG